MLTKELLQFKMRQGRVHPILFPKMDEEVLALARQVLSLYEGSAGKTLGSLHQLIYERCSPHKMLGPLEGVLDQRLLLRPVSDDVGERRWGLLTAAQEIRQRKGLDSFTAFQEELAAKFSKTFQELSSILYEDLIHQRTIEGFLTTSVDDLAEAYNMGQYCGLLALGKEFAVQLKGTSVVWGNAAVELRSHRFFKSEEVSKQGCCFTFSSSAKQRGDEADVAQELLGILKCLRPLGGWKLRALLTVKKKPAEFLLTEKALSDAFT